MERLINETDFFKLYSISEGVYAAIAKPGKGAWSNAGIVDLGDEIIVFDSLSTPSAGYELRRQAELITSKRVKYLINSHYHGDHVFGNQAFLDATIISTVITKKYFKERNKLQDLEIERKEMEKYLVSLKDQIESNTDEIIQSSLTNQYNEMSKVLADLPNLRLVLPKVLFEEKLIIEGSKRKVELYCFGGGHTPSDAIMFLPNEKIAFMGDLLTVNLHVPIHNPEVFYSILIKVKEMDINTFVPGHGNYGNKQLLKIMTSYLSYLIETSKEAIGRNLPLDSFLSHTTIPEQYREWNGINGVKGNLTKVYNFYCNTNK
ncbi:MBL fold metallo-hydrolase [Fredinandcohnia sp. QZ13]|uniref:MBL fold metallo-hydrolase n=1 Tax=Fredinandcohnia sp. QZ13 TaxID=3073144 RepID=UPI0028530B18|nr:MBL fold metallo-hydrolase [Fredinandcohnia sp. QZ13]MDR4886141.1 MBL fold metallo-hydrolase [Fredinandcohnia sp. QZ13]